MGYYKGPCNEVMGFSRLENGFIIYEGGAGIDFQEGEC
jgi:hypothetical protein